MHNTSQVILRNHELMGSGRWLIANAQDAEVFDELKQQSAARFCGFHQYFGVYQGCNDPQQHKFGAEYRLEHQPPFDGALMVLPKAKAQAKMLLANLATVVKSGGTLLLVGENNTGGKSAGKLLECWGENVIKQDSARHCSLYSTTLQIQNKAFDLQTYLNHFEVEVNATRFPVVSLPGVFSHKSLDPGTQLLLEHIEHVPIGRILDFACGSGVIGTYLALKNPSIALVMSDVSALALYCAQKTATLNQIEAEVIASDGLSAIEGSFNAIYTNPPFHTGVKTDYAITQNLLKQLKHHLRSPGKLLLVANRFLKYPGLIEQQLGNCETVAQTSKFNLYQAKVR